ncbi:MAG TPA: TolC family protein [Bacteroidales bacterium]|nr:TolC family protein [Bacteroidales bacterium]
MNKIQLASNIVVMLLVATGLFAQEDTKLALSLDGAKEYALQHNKMIKTSKYDLQAAEMAKWEVISAGLPRVDGSASLSDNLKLMTTLLPGEFFGQPGEKIPVQFGSKYNTGYGVQATQLLFNAPYFVGIQTVKLAEEISRQALEKSEIDVKEMLVNTYYLILISEESLVVMNETMANLNSVYGSTKAMHSVGMAEITDVDQMLSNVNILKSNISSLERNLELSYNLLRFQLGVGMETEIELTTTLEAILTTTDIYSVLDLEFDLRNNIDYKLLSSQEEIQALNLKNEKASLLPTLSAFYQWNRNGMGDKLNDQQWFPNSMLGFQISVPIFASGQRYSKIKKARINLEKAQTSKDMISDQLELSEKQLRYNMINAREQFDTQKENVEVAMRVYRSFENKYKEGIASSLDLTQAHNNYLQTQNGLFAAIMDLLQTKLALDRLLNNI